MKLQGRLLGDRDEPAGAGRGAVLAQSRAERAGGLVRQGILLAVCILMAIGLVVVASVEGVTRAYALDRGFFATDLGRHAAFVVLGLSAMLAIAYVIGPWMLSRPRLFFRVSMTFVLVAALLLGVVLMIGSATRGSVRWLRFSVAGVPVGVQPSEVAKLAVVLGLAAWYGVRIRQGRRSAWETFGVIVALLGAGALVGSQNLSTAVLVTTVGFALCLIGGARLEGLAALALLGLLGISGLIWAKPYRWTRITSFTDVWNDPQGADYQALQSLMTVTSGDWAGRGLGSGMQKHGFLPEVTTDFVFAQVCEEAGLLGGFLVMALYLSLIGLGAWAMEKAAMPWESLVAFGVTFLLGIQAALHIAVVTASCPPTGVSLPFVSEGGSGLVVLGAAAGFLGAVAARAGKEANFEERIAN